MFNIDIVADFVCPWCFIGKHRLQVAIDALRQERPDLALRTRWRPFFLNPDTPAEGEPYLPFLEQKFGGRAAVESLFERVRSSGRPDGVDFAFEKIALRANTLLAHRLVFWAQQRGAADALVERLFVAQFQRGEAIGEPAVLARLAEECGYPAEKWRQWCADGSDIEPLRADAQRLLQLGIRQVPTFIVDDGRLVVGAEDSATLLTAMREALA